jgi:thiamine-phosphate pyrophosphorylase
MSTPRILCLTADGLPHSHVEQVQDFCFAGAEWIQLRSKQLSDCELEPIAFEALQVCRQYGSRLLINDRLDLALKIEADGAHLGRQDGDWAQARARAGKDFLLGGTVNCLADARAALASQALDYCGVGPYKFTRTKAQLAPLLAACGLAGDLAAIIRSALLCDWGHRAERLARSGKLSSERPGDLLSLTSRWAPY